MTFLLIALGVIVAGLGGAMVYLLVKEIDKLKD